jgi:hypothetical protein
MSNITPILNISIPLEVGIAIGAGTSFVGIFLISLILWFVILDNVVRDTQVKRTYIDNDIYTLFITFTLLFFTVLYSIVNFFVTLALSFLYFLNNNAFLVGGLLITSAASGVWLQYHDVAVKSWIIWRQCVSRFFIDIIVFPLLNMIRMLWNLLIGFWDAIWDFSRFLRTGQYRVIFACFRVNGFLVPISLFGNIFQEFGNDAVDFVLLGAGIFTDRFTVISTMTAISDFLVSLAPTLICFCAILEFLWVTIANVVSLQSTIIAADALFNVFVRILQIPIDSILTFTLPSITKTVEEFNAFVVPIGDSIEELIFLLLETFFQVISIFGTIPNDVLQLFNAHYMRVITQPLACIAILLNMTLEASTHFEEIIAPDRSGIKYFQFGQIIDRLNDASAGFSQLFIIIGTSEECFVRELIDTIINIVNIFLQMIPGALFFVFLPSCCQNPLDFFVEYWFTPGNALAGLFPQIELITGCMRDILSNLNAPFACSIQHLLNMVVELLSIITQILIFSLDIITFQPFPTLLDINLDPLFTEFILWCQCTADIIRQFDPNFCVPQPGDNKQTLICCTGDLLVTLCNLFSNLLRQVIDFIFDIITLPTGTIIIANIRIPVFNDAIQYLNTSMCELACMVTSVVPLDLKCQFINTNITCNTPEGCAATLICDVTSGLLIPLILFNDFLIKLRTSGFFDSLFVWITEPTTLITQWVADVIDFLGAFLDCIICTALDNGVNCTDDTYQVTHSVAILLPTIRPFFTSVMMIIIKIILALIKGLFVDHQPIGSILEAVFQFLSQVMGTLGPALVQFIADLFNKIGLSFLGNFIKALWIGLCPLLQFVVNFITTFLNVFSFGLFNLPSSNYCCGGGNCTLQPSKRDTGSLSQQAGPNDPVSISEDGQLYPTLNNWISTFLAYTSYWNSTDKCNASMASYAQMNFDDLTQLQRFDSIYCMMKIYWPMRTDNLTDLMYSKCDGLFETYTQNNIDFITDLRTSEQYDIMECMESRVIIDSFRTATGLHWIPQDLITNTWRKFYWGADILKGLSVYFEYYSDRSTQPQNLLTPEYKSRWQSLGFNTTYLDNLQTVEDVNIMLKNTGLKDYFTWNNATQYDAVVFITLGFWNMTSSIISTMIESIVVNSDSITNNLTGVLLSDPSETPSIISGSIFGLLYQLLSAMQAVTNYWSNPGNLKRSLDAFEYYSDAARRRLQQSIRLFVKWVSESDTEINTEMKFREWKVMKFIYSWSFNHIPTVYTRNSTSPVIDYIQHLRDKSDLPEIAIRQLLFNTLSKPDNREYFIYNATSTEFNIMLMKDNNLLDDPESGEDRSEPYFHRKWKRITGILSSIFKGGEKSKKVWKTMDRIRAHLGGIFHGLIVNANQRLKWIEMSEEYQRNPIHQREGTYTPLPTTYVVYDKASDSYIVTLIESSDDHTGYIKRSNQIQPGINITDYNVTIPACASTVPDLCQDCYYLDQLVGRLNSSVQHALDFAISPSFQFNIIMARSFLTYTQNPLATAVVGGGQNCSMRFPSNLHSNLCYFNDRDPKIYFSDVAGFFDNLTLPPQSDAVCGPNSVFFINWIICPIFGSVINWFEKFFYNLIIGTTSPQAIMTGLFEAFYQCDWDTWQELTGVNKRFALGQTLVISVCTVFLLSLGISAVFPSYIGTIFSLVFTSTTAMLLLGGYLVLTYGWSYGCGFALPFDLGNDLFNFTVYILAPKCEVWLSSLINEEYTNDNCYSCSQANSYTYANCKNDLGFQWFWDNVVFIFQYYWPESIAWLRTAPFPLTLLFNIPYFEQTLNKFANVDWNDPVQYSQYQSCALGYTFLPNYAIFNFLLLTASGALSPAALSIIVNILIQIFLLILYLFLLMQMIFTSVFYLEIRTAYVQSGLIDENAAEKVPKNMKPRKISYNKYFPLGAQNDPFYDSDDDSDSDDDDSNIQKGRKKKRKTNKIYEMIMGFPSHIKYVITFYGNEFYYLLFDKKNSRKNK